MNIQKKRRYGKFKIERMKEKQRKRCRMKGKKMLRIEKLTDKAKQNEAILINIDGKLFFVF